MTDVFKPYETLYVDASKQYGNINLSNSRAKMLELLPFDSDFEKLPYYCYAYDSIFSKIVRADSVDYSPTIYEFKATPFEYGDVVKHYISFFPNMIVNNCLATSDIIDNNAYDNNIGAFKPLDIFFDSVALGMQYTLINKSTKVGVVVSSTKDLIDNYNNDDWVVISTQCNIWYKSGDFFTYNGNGTNDISINYNIGDKLVFGNMPLEYGQHGLQLVPQWYFRLGENTGLFYSPFMDKNNKWLCQGVDFTEFKINTTLDFCDVSNGVYLYKSAEYYDFKEYKPVVSVSQIIKEVAFLGLAVCDFESYTNLYYGYINLDGLATGTLLTADDWDKSDSLNKNNKMSDYNESLEIKPKPLPDDVDDIQQVGYGYFSNTTMGALYALKNKLDLEKITQWLLTQTEKIDIANNVVSLKEIPFSLSTLGITPIDTNLTIGGTNVTYQGSNVVVGEIVAPTIPTLSVIFADFDIPRLSNTFLDYSPYTKYELLLPFAPSPISLPDWCINKNVKAIFLYDIYTTACQYIVECNGERICSVSGNFGIDRPISAQNVAIKDASRLSAQISTASSVLGGVMSGATGNVGGIISGAVGGVSALSQMILSGKQNYMYTIGANGDSSSIGLYHAAHLKITRTLSNEDANFKHVYGKPLCKVRKLSDLTGYTKCDNVNTSGLTCSESEKQMIKNMLESGIHI